MKGEKEDKDRVLMPVSPKDDEVREGEEDAEVGEESEISERDRGNENVVVRRQKEVIAPTSEEMRAHRATHIPFRNWCPECVAGRGKDEAHHHRLQGDQEKKIK